MERLLAAAEGGVTKFRFCLMGSSQQPVIEVDVACLHDLHQLLSTNRFIEGRLVEIDGDGVQCNVLIAATRVQMVVEVS